MPDDYYYNDFIKDGKKTLIYSKKLDEFIRKTVYSDIAAKGEIEAKGKAALPYTVKWSQMQYREFFKKLDFTEGRNYYVDPYAQLTDLDYLMKVIKELSDANSNMYVFYSMFDLDFFVRKNYTRQSFKNEREAWEYAYDRVNDSITGKVSTTEEIEMRNKMVVPLLGVFEENNTRISTEFIPLFLENEISKYLEAREVINKRLAGDKLIKLYNEAIDSKTAKNVKDFFKEFKKTHGLPWPTTLSLDEVTRAEILSKEGSTSRLGDRDLGIMKKLEVTNEST